MRSDANQESIVAALRDAGVKVHVIEQPVDLLCWKGEYRVLEVKNPNGRNRTTPAQDEFIAEWPVDIVRSVEEALEIFK